MSVINKMLKDLDQRQDQQGSQNSEPSATASSSIASTTRNKPSYSILTFVLIVIAALLAFIGYQMLLNNKGQSEPAVSQVSPSLAASSTDQATQVEPQDTALEQEADPDPSAELEQAPPPEVEVVTELPDESDTAVPEMVAEAGQTTEQTAEPERTTEPEKTVSQPADPIVESAKKEVVETKPEPSFVIEKTSAQLTPEQRVERLLDKAKGAYEKGYITEAIEDLTKLLSISDGHVEARTLLAGAWYGRGEGNRAIAILNDGLQRYPLIEEWRTTAAKIFFKENRLEGALSYLDVELSNASKEFYTLKGNLARQLKQFPAAELAYGKLTELEPFVGNWWLGLAIAQDSQAKSQQALQSYIKVVETGGVSAQSLSFAQQRIEKLKG